MSPEDDEIRLGRFRQSEIDYAIRGLFSGRAGPRGRTFHLGVRSITRASGGVEKAIAGVQYDSRQGEHEKRRDELELEAGYSSADMAQVIAASDLANTRANGKLVVRGELELPATFPHSARRAVAEGLAEWFVQRGCPAHVAVHTLNSRRLWQPHAHFTAAARPVRRVEGQWIGTASGARGRGSIPAVIDGRAAMRAFRADLATLINTVAQQHDIDLGPGGWHPGKLEATGIHRAPKARLPMAVFKASESRRYNARLDEIWGPSPNGPQRSSAAINAGRHTQVREDRAAWRRQFVAEQRAKIEAAEAGRLEKLRLTEAQIIRRRAEREAARQLVEAKRAAKAAEADQARLDRLEQRRQQVLARRRERQAAERRRRRIPSTTRTNEDAMPTVIKPLTASQIEQLTNSLATHNIQNIPVVIRYAGSDHRMSKVVWALYSAKDPTITVELKKALAVRMAQLAAYASGGGSTGVAETMKFRPNPHQIRRPIAAAAMPPAAQASAVLTAPSQQAPAPVATPNETAWHGLKSYDQLAGAYAKLDKTEKEQRYGAVPVVSVRDESALQAAAIALKPLDAMNLILAYHKTAAAARRIAQKPSQTAVAADIKLGLSLLRAEMRRRGIEPPAQQKTVVRERARELDR